MENLENKLSQLNASFWRYFRAHSLQFASRALQREWWHNKLYEFNPPNDGDSEQVVFGTNHREVPYQRELFYPSLNGRFSLGAAPVAYFSQDFGVNCCEVIEQFRSNEALHFDELRAYLQGDVSVEDDWFGYPTPIRVEPKALVADLSSVGNPLLNEIHAGRDPGSVRQFYEETVIAWNPNAKRRTQAIARAIAEAGFDGILYRSVRAPSGVALPSGNLVLFSNEYVIRSPWDPDNPNGFQKSVSEDGWPPSCGG